jgi:hypothetical protein
MTSARRGADFGTVLRASVAANDGEANEIATIASPAASSGLTPCFRIAKICLTPTNNLKRQSYANTLRLS